MTTQNKFNILAAVTVAMTMQSCGDFLDHLPDDRTEIDSVDKVQKLLINSYPTSNYYWLCEISSDNLLDNQTPHLPSNPNKKQITTYYNYAPYDRWEDELYSFEPARTATFNDSDSPGSVWEGYYGSVASANYCIQTLDELESKGVTVDAKFRALRAEAQLIRAYDHFSLVNVFSQAYINDAENAKNIGVPYVTEPETTMQKEYDRGTVAETYRMIQKDLEEALPNISDNYMGAVKYHFNTQAAHAFAARFYLFTHQWDKVIEHANAVIGTDSASVEKLMMDWSGFDDCSYSDDYAKIWQGPDQPSNLMIIGTYSLLQRRAYGNRYSLAGEKCQDVLLVRTSNSYWSGYICPVQCAVGGMLFGSSMHDYGFFSGKIAEEFEYSDKLAGIGYCHIMCRAFTTAELLLERAEANLMLGNIEAASRDLCQYWNSPYFHMSESNKEKEKSHYTMLTDALIKRYFTQSVENTTDKDGRPVSKRKISNRNCFLPEEWDQFASNVQNVYNVPADIHPYMNCLNEFRRFEFCFEGMRFFDLKRWGIPYEHHQGSDDDVFVMQGVDDKRAIELPWESLSAGLLESRRTTSTVDTRSLTLPSTYSIVSE